MTSFILVKEPVLVVMVIDHPDREKVEALANRARARIAIDLTAIFGMDTKEANDKAGCGCGG